MCCDTVVVPVVIGGLGSVLRDLVECLNLIGLEKWTIPALYKRLHVLLNSYVSHYYLVGMCPNTLVIVLECHLIYVLLLNCD